MKNGNPYAVLLSLLLVGVAGAQQGDREQVIAIDVRALPSATLPDTQPAQSGSVPQGQPPTGTCGNSCGNSCIPQSCCQPCGAPGTFWLSTEYLLWWTKGDKTPPLITTGPASSAGILGRPGTEVLFGNSDINDDLRSGFRINGGMWLDDCHTVGLEAGYFFLDKQSKDFPFSGSGAPGSPVLARPFFNVVTGMEDSELDAFPGVASGTKVVHTSSEFQGAEANGICRLLCCRDCCGCGYYSVDLLGGFRFLALDEDLFIGETISVFPNVPTIGGTQFTLADDFRTTNRFYGGQIGARAEFWRNQFFVDVIGKVALGVNNADVDVSGSTLIVPPGGAPFLGTGGLLAQSSNIGHFERDEFSVVPEVTINVGYQINCHLRAFIGYNFIYWSSVFRPGEQIDRELNPTLFPTTGGTVPVTGPIRPLPVLKESDFWAQGVNFGLEFRY
jgi:hypothetical protein